MDTKLLRDDACYEKFGAGQPIVSQSGERMLYVIISGRVGIYDTSGRQTGTLGPGRCINGRNFFFGYKEQRLIPLEDAVVYGMTRYKLLELLKLEPQAAYELLQEAYAAEAEFAMIDTAVRGRMPQTEAPVEQEARRPLTTAPQNTYEEAPPEILPEVQEPIQQAGKQPQVHDDTALFLAMFSGNRSRPSFFPNGHKGYPGVLHEEYKKYIFEKEYTCPCCGQRFKSYKIFQSKLVTEKPMRYDTRQYFKEFSQEWYDVITCQRCYFSTFTSLFLEPKNFSKAIVTDRLAQIRKEFTLNFAAERDLDFVFAVHFIALECSAAFSLFRQINAKLWNNLSWLYEDAGDTEMEAWAARKAAEVNERLFLEAQLAPAQEQSVALTIAGMFYRIKSYNDMRRWLFEVKRIKLGKKSYLDLADDLIDAARGEGPQAGVTELAQEP